MASFSTLTVAALLLALCFFQVFIPECMSSSVPDTAHSLLKECLSKKDQLHDEMCSLKRDCGVRPDSPFNTLGDKVNPATSCFEIAQRRRNAASGTYYIYSAKNVTQVYCFLGSLGKCGGQGWTPLMKIDGRKTTFRFSSSLWTSHDLHNVAGGLTGFDDSEAKLSTYNDLPFTQLCIVFRPVSTHQFGYVHLQIVSPETLYSLIHRGQYRRTSVGRGAWLSAIPGAGLQAHCNREGFNAVADNPHHSKARIGIIGNNENDCDTVDTAFGVGLYVFGCYIDRSPLSAGSLDNAPCTESGASVRHAFAYILAQ